MWKIKQSCKIEWYIFQTRPTAEKSLQILWYFFIDHEEAVTRLVALVKVYKYSNNEKLLVRSSSGGIDIIVLFMLHCSSSNIFFDFGHGNSRKIIDIRFPMLSKIEYQGLSGIRAYSGNIYISSFFWKDKKMFWKALLNLPECIHIFAKNVLYARFMDTRIYHQWIKYENLCSRQNMRKERNH